MSFTNTAEYVEYIGYQYFIGLNKLHYLERMKQVIEYYNINNILSKTPEIWNYYSQNWDAVLQKENANYMRYLSELKKIGEVNSHVKNKIMEITRNGPEKPTMYVLRANFYDRLGIHELKEQKEKINSQMNDAIYNYDYEKYIKYNEEFVYICKLLDGYIYNLMLQKEIENAFQSQTETEIKNQTQTQTEIETSNELKCL